MAKTVRGVSTEDRQAQRQLIERMYRADPKVYVSQIQEQTRKELGWTPGYSTAKKGLQAAKNKPRPSIRDPLEIAVSSLRTVMASRGITELTVSPDSCVGKRVEELRL